MSIELKYQGYNRSKTSDGNVTTQTYVGLEEEIKTYAEGLTLGATSTLGTLQNVTIQQDEGPFWSCSLQWSTEKDSNGNDIGDGTLSQSKMSTLSVRSMSMPLESHPQYRMHWNHILIGLGKPGVPSFWSSANAKNSGITQETAKKYRWVKEYSEIPIEKTDGKTWSVVKQKTKPGIECYTYPIYQLTEVSRHNSKSSAGWAVRKKIGKISSPSNGDFGVKSKNGGNWLCEGGSISYNGKKWQATCTFAHSPDGWDTDLYD